MVNAEWQLKTISKQSQLTGSPFEVGQRIISYIFKDDSGKIHRNDIHAVDLDKYDLPGTLLGWWEQVVKNYDDEIEAEKHAVNSSEELFLSLYEGEEAETHERDVIKFLLALIYFLIKFFLKEIQLVGDKYGQKLIKLLLLFLIISFSLSETIKGKS